MGETKGGQAKWVLNFQIGLFQIPTSDFGHANINKYSQRLTPTHPTQGSVEREMIDNILGLVRPHHRVLHLGDVAFRNFDIEELSVLPGKWDVLRGNHDKHISPADFAAIGWTEIEAPIIEFDGAKILFTHYPQYQLEPMMANVHGHVHNNPYTATHRHINLSVELWHYAPVAGRLVAEQAAWSAKARLRPDVDGGARTIKYRGKR